MRKIGKNIFISDSISDESTQRSVIVSVNKPVDEDRVKYLLVRMGLIGNLSAESVRKSMRDLGES